MRKIILLVVFIVALANTSFAQQDSIRISESIGDGITALPANILQIELGGNAHFLSLNYEHIYENHLGYRLGIGLTLANIDKELYVQSYSNSDLVGVGIMMGEYHFSLSKGYFIKTGLGIVSLLSFNYDSGSV